jgi:hypothetical protein
LNRPESVVDVVDETVMNRVPACVPACAGAAGCTV